MGNEQISVEVETIPQPSDHDKKRKLEELRADAPENVDVPDVENKHSPEKEEENVTEEDGGGELKRARIEKIEEDNDLEEAGIESEVPLEKSENGSNENGFKDNRDKVVDAEEEKVDQEPESLQDNVPKEDTGGVEQPQETSASDDVGQVADGNVQVQKAAESEQSPGQNEQSIENESGHAKLEGMEAYSDINLDGDGLIAEQKSESTDEIVSRKIEVSNNKVGVLIGKAGDTIKYLQYNSGAKIQIMRDSEADSLATTRPVELIGTLDCIEKAERLIKDVIAEAEAGGSPALVARGFNSVQAVVGGEQVEMQVPNEKVGSIIGRGGENIKYLQTRSGARIQLVPQHLPSGDQSKERTVRMTGDKKQIEMAKEMIKEVMNQNSRSSSHSGGYNQHSHRSRGHGGSPHWGHRNNHPSHSMGYGGYQQRGPYQPQNHQQYPPAYGNYPPQQAAPRGNYGPSWEQRPPSNMQGPPPQSNYNYGQPQGPDYGHQNPYSQQPAQSYGQGYNNEMRYDNTVPPQQPYGGPGVPQPTGYHHGGGGVQAGYGPQDHYGRPSPYGMQQQQPAQVQAYGQPRPSQPGENPYHTPVSATQPYGSNVPPQQSYPYAASGPVQQQTYPMYPSGPTTTDGYTQPASGGPVYPQQGGGQYPQPVTAPPQQQPSGYAVAGPTTGYGSYPSQQGGYLEQQPAANTAAYGGYQQPTAADPAAYASAQGSTGYAQPAPSQPGYAQPAPTQPGYAQPAPSQPGYAQPAPSQPGYAQPATTQPVYDQSIPPQSGGYGTAAAPAGYGNNVSPQPGYPPQYDANQMYAAPPR